MRGPTGSDVLDLGETGTVLGSAVQEWTGHGSTAMQGGGLPVPLHRHGGEVM